MRAASSVGNPRASSNELVCRDCVPPSTAAMACTAVRTMLFSGCWAVSMEPQHQRPRILGAEALLHDAGPHPAGGAILGHFLQKIVMSVEEERESRGKAVDIQARLNRRLDIGYGIAEGKRYLLDGGGTSFTHVVAGDRNRIPLRHLLAAKRTHVGDDSQCICGRIDVGSARDVFLENVILDCAAELVDVCSSPLCHRHI